MEKRIIIVNQSNGAPMQEVETIAQTWGELQADLSTAGVNYSGMKAILGETRTTLESNNARLPLESIINLFLLPRKTKSGVTKNNNMSKKPETKAVVKKATKIPKATLTEKSPTPKSSLQAAAQEAIAETKKEMNDVEKVQQAINILRTVINPNVKVKIDAQIADLDDINYIIATGRPRKDNLKSKKSACELMQDGNLGLQNNC